MPSNKSPELDVDGLRSRTQIADIITQIEANKKKITIPGSVVNELRSYLDTSCVPKRISADRQDSVTAAQEALQKLQSRVDRVLEVTFRIHKVDQVLGHLEILAKRDLAEAGILTHKTSGAAVKQVIGMVLPELAIHQHTCSTVLKLCQQVQEHLGNAKDTIRLQIKLDENANWSRRYGA